MFYDLVRLKHNRKNELITQRHSVGYFSVGGTSESSCNGLEYIRNIENRGSNNTEKLSHFTTLEEACTEAFRVGCMEPFLLGFPRAVTPFATTVTVTVERIRDFSLQEKHNLLFDKEQQGNIVPNQI